MDKTGRIVAAALLAASITYVTPAFSVQTSAEMFVRDLSADFAVGDLGGVEAMLLGLKNHGFEGVLADRQIMRLGRLMEILAQVRSGELDPDQVARNLLRVIAGATHVRFIAGDIKVGSVDFDQNGTLFPAGSAG